MRSRMVTGAVLERDDEKEEADVVRNQNVCWLSSMKVRYRTDIGVCTLPCILYYVANVRV